MIDYMDKKVNESKNNNFHNEDSITTENKIKDNKDIFKNLINVLN